MQPNNHINQNTFYFATTIMAMPAIHAKQSPTIQREDDKSVWVGLTRQQVMQKCNRLGLNTVCFAHWLAIYEFKILLVFKNNKCVIVEYL